MGPGGVSVAPSWALAFGLAAMLFAYGAIDGIATYRRYFHGERGMGVVTHVADGTTVMQINGQVCAVSGELGRIGQMLPVAYPAGFAGDCVVRRPSAFRWPGGALFASIAIWIGVFFFRRSSTAAAAAATSTPPAT